MITETRESLLRDLAKMKNLIQGMCLHYEVVSYAMEDDISFGSIVIQFYIRCGSLDDAKSCFSRTDEKHINAWNCMIGAFSQRGESEEMRMLFWRMQRESVLADKITWLAMLSASREEIDNIVYVKKMHVHMGQDLSVNDVVMGTSLLHMYAKSGCMLYAWKVFSHMAVRNVITWSTMIAQCAKHGQREEALVLFSSMLEEGILPNSFTFMSILSACTCLRFAKNGRYVHARITGSEVETHPYMWNALTNMYGRWGVLDEADAAFDVNSKQSVSAWNIILAAHVHHGKLDDASQIFEKMLDEDIVPDTATFTSILSVYANQIKLTKGMDIHSIIVSVGFESDLTVANSLINMYGKCKCFSTALKLLREMSETDVVAWNTLISSYCDDKCSNEARLVFQQMVQEGRAPNEITYSCILDTFSEGRQVLTEGKRIHSRVFFQSNVVITTSLVNMYGNCGSLQDALEAFHERKVQNVLLWNSIFAVCNQYDKGEEVLNLFVEMHRDEAITPDNFTLSNVLSACSSQVALREGRKIHNLSVEYNFTQDTVVGTALINMYGKCGSLEDARGIFDNIFIRDVVLWSAIINVYAQHGYGREVVQLFDEMKRGKAVPNKITYVSVLSACSRAGLINEGRRLFSSMEHDHGIIPSKEHCDCMVDLLAKSGLLDEAEDLIRNMPFSTTYASWSTILSACKNEGDIERGERIGMRLIELYPEEACLYVVLSQIYTLAGREIDAADILEKMKEKCAQKL